MAAHLGPDMLQRTFMKLFGRVAKPFTHPWKQGDAKGLPPTSESRNLQQSGGSSTQRHTVLLRQAGRRELSIGHSFSAGPATGANWT